MGSKGSGKPIPAFKTCRACGITEESGKFIANRNFHPDCHSEWRKERSRELKADNPYVVYVLPQEDPIYCGVTRDYEGRMRHHKLSKNIEGVKQLFITYDKREAYHVEAMFQSTCGMDGLIINNSDKWEKRKKNTFE